MPRENRSEVARLNERVKFFSTINGNLGTALLASAFARWFFGGFDLPVFLWLTGAAFLIWLGWYVLLLLEE